jgi:hypothetical protein
VPEVIATHIAYAPPYYKDEHGVWLPCREVTSIAQEGGQTVCSRCRTVVVVKK